MNIYIIADATRFLGATSYEPGRVGDLQTIRQPLRRMAYNRRRGIGVYRRLSALFVLCLFHGDPGDTLATAPRWPCRCLNFGQAAVVQGS